VAFFLGIDGGGTRTRCIIGDDESELGRGSSSSCKVQKVGELCARDSLSAAIHEACVQAGISPRKISRTCAGITGAARPEIAATMRDLVMSAVAGEVEVVGDIDVAFADAFGKDPGVLVIAGTGAIAYGRSSSGQTARAGGWGYLVSDEGSGSWIGIEAVRSALRKKDLGENPGLLKSLSAGLGSENLDDFIVKLNSNSVPDFSSLFPAVLSSAQNNDRLAQEVLECAGRELANLAEIIVRRLFGKTSCSVITHGGVFSSSEIVRSSFEKEIRVRNENVNVLQKTIDPARGALQRARLALKAASF
jgi:glucosamine kinase